MSISRGFILFSILFLSKIIWCQKIEFFREELVFTLDTVSFTVNGDYWFRNASNAGLTPRIYFPVCKTPGKPAFDTIVVYDTTDPDHPITARINDTVAFFSINMPPFSSRCFKIFYKQHHTGSRACYILQTTAQWDKPLAYAKYTLVIPAMISISGFSIPPDRSEDFGGTRLYFWERYNYMPVQDFYIDFSLQNTH